MKPSLILGDDYWIFDSTLIRKLANHIFMDIMSLSRTLRISSSVRERTGPDKRECESLSEGLPMAAVCE